MRPVPIAASVLIAAMTTLPVQVIGDETAAVPTVLSLGCHEQPSLRVVVDRSGTLASESVDAALSGAITLRIVNIDRGASGPHLPARIDSDEPGLRVRRAIWQPGDAVVDPDGHLRLDLTDDSLFVVEPKLGNQALFRRFSCTRGQGATRYRCGPENELWISLDKDGATLRYGGDAELRLPRVRSSDGERFASDGATLLITGDEAIYTPADADERRCQEAD